jgi:molybdopterin molybdotransferase
LSAPPALGSPLLRLEDALERMLAGVEALPVSWVRLGEARGRVLAQPVRSRLMLPPWDNSAMDGFAVRAADVAAATDQRPVRLAVAGEAAAGRRSVATVEQGTAVRILTGAPLPAGADAVVPVEDTDAQPGVAGLPPLVAVHRPVPAGAHVRRAGSDLEAGAPLLEAGVELTPAGLALVAAGGHAHIGVHRQARVAVLATGDELVPPGEPLGDAQIPDSNSVGLLAQAAAAGAEPIPLGIAGDDLESVVGRLAEGIARADAVLVSGGVSVGAHDVVKDAFARLGTVELWRVAVQPGKPLAFARADTPDGRRVLLFGLPGNPVSAFVTFELFVRPVLRRLAGHRQPVARQSVHARLAEPVSKSPGRRAFLRVRLQLEGGAWQARLAGGQGSHVLSALAFADGLAVVPEEVESLPAGAEVEVVLLRDPAG